MSKTEPASAADDLERDRWRTFDIRLDVWREQAIRSGEIHPDPDKPQELRWAKQGPVDVRDLDAVKVA